MTQKFRPPVDETREGDGVEAFVMGDAGQHWDLQPADLKGLAT